MLFRDFHVHFFGILIFFGIIFFHLVDVLQIERELAELSCPEFDDDAEEESVIDPHPLGHSPFQGSYNSHASPAFQPQHHQQSTPFQSRQAQYEASQEEAILNGNQKSSEQLEILYNARGLEMTRLKEENANLAHKFSSEIRHLKHENTLLKAESGKHQINLEHYQKVASAQSEENQVLRREVEDLKVKLSRFDQIKSELNGQVESSNLMIQTLHGQLNDLQKSDTILRAKKQHEETLRSLKERHEAEVFGMQQEIDNLNANLRRNESELEAFSTKLRKSQMDYERQLLEKSDTIKDLQDRLDLAQRKMANYLAETSAEGYTKVKAMHDRFQTDREKFAVDICTYQV